MTDLTSAPLFTTHYHVYINHTDAGGIVYHANHLVFFENCRRDWFTHLGLNTYFLQNDNGDIQHFVVSQADIKYHHAILLDERIAVQIDHIELKPASLIFHQSIRRQINDDNNTKTNANDARQVVLSRAKIVIACVQNQANDDSKSSGSIRPIRVPKLLHDIIQNALNQQSFASSR